MGGRVDEGEVDGLTRGGQAVVGAGLDAVILANDLNEVTLSNVETVTPGPAILFVDPPVVPINSSGNPFNATFHDVVGRTYMAGLRARF